MVVKEAALHDVQTLQRLQALDHLCPHGYVAGKWILCCAGCSVVSDPATPWTVAHQARLSMIFPRREYYSRMPFPSPFFKVSVNILKELKTNELREGI